jgi:hypothetical protein
MHSSVSEDKIKRIMARNSRRRLPLSSLDNTEPSRRSKSQKTGEESDEALENAATPSVEAEAVSDEQTGGGDNSEELDDRDTTGEAVNEVEHDNLQQSADASDEPEGLWGPLPEIPDDLNFRCIKAIDQHIPKHRGKGKMQPPPTFRTELPLLFEWRLKTQEEQRVAKAQFTSKAAPEKARLKRMIPGSDCACCRRKTRNDRGQRRGGGRTARVAGEAVAPPVPNTNPQQPDTTAGIPYTSLGSSEAERNNILPPKRRCYKRPSSRRLEHARTVQGQNGMQAFKAVSTANRSFARALTACTVKPKFDGRSSKFVYLHPSTAPRHFGLQVWVNQVSETRMSGGVLAPGQLRKEKTEITYISTSPEDAQQVLDIITNDVIANREKYEKRKYFGTGSLLFNRLAAAEAEIKNHRAKLDAAAVEESEEAILRSDAPTEAV